MSKYKLKLGEDAEFIYCEQGTDEWQGFRAGKCTASRAAAVMAKGKGELFGKGAKTYLNEIIAERITKLYKKLEGIEALEWGKRLEDEARQHYIELTGNKVQQVGFVKASEYVGCSPDGLLIGEDGELVGLLEIKCPINNEKVVAYFTDGLTDVGYKAQVQMQMLITGAPYTDFVVYSPNFPADMGVYIERVEADEAYQSRLVERLEAFSVLIDETEQQIRTTQKHKPLKRSDDSLEITKQRSFVV